MTTDSTTTPSLPPPAPQRRASKWWRRLKVALLILVLLVVATRVAIYVLLPGAIRKAAAYYGLDATFDRQELKLVGGDAALWHLTLTPKTGGQPVLVVDYVRGDISVLSLLRGRLDVWRADADGVELLIERDPSGRIPWLQRLNATSATKAPPTAAKRPTTRPLNLTPPLRLDALRLQHVRARVVDRSVAPPFEAEVAMDMRLSNVGSSTRPIRFEMDVASPPILDSLFVQGEGHATGSAVDAEIRARVRGLRPRNAAAYLKPLGLAAEANEVTGDFTGRVQVAARPNESDAVGVSLALRDVRLAADGAEAAAVRGVTLTAPRLTPARAIVDEVVIDGVRLNAGRAPDGVLHAAGLRLIPRKAPGGATRPAAHAAVARVPTTQPGTPFRASVNQIAIRDVSFTFDDRAVTPPARLAFVLDQLHLNGIRLDPAAPAAPLAVDGTFHLPGIARAGTLAGRVQPFGPTRRANLDLQVTGIRPNALTSYLTRLGLESTLRDGAATLTLDATATREPTGDLVLNATARNLQFRDGPAATLANVDTASIANLRVSPDRDRISVQSIEITAPTTSLRREASGALAALGFRYAPHAAATQRAAEPAPSGERPSTGPKKPLPHVQIALFRWTDTHVSLTDEAVTPATSLTITDAGFELRNVVFDPSRPARSPGHFRAWLMSPQLAKTLAAEGTLALASNGAAVDCQLAGDAVSLAPLGTYLTPLGVEPLLRSGSLRGHLYTRVASDNRTVTASLRIDNFRYADGPTELAGVDALTIDNARLVAADKEVRLADVAVFRPRAAIARDADGSIITAGVRLRPDKFPKRPPAARPTVAVVGHLAITDAAVLWTDRAVTPSVQTTAHVTAEVKTLTVNRPGAPPGDVRAMVRVDGTADAVAVAGKIRPDAKAPAATVLIDAAGLRAGPLASYLPPTIRPELRDGRLRASVDAALAPSAAGGQSARLLATNVDFRDGTTSLLKVDTARTLIQRFDAAAMVMNGDEVSIAGVETGARMSADGRLHLLGVSLGRGADSAAAAKPAGGSAPATQPTTATFAEAVARRAVPVLTLKKLDVNVRRFDWVDDRRAGGMPVSVRDLRFVATAPIDWGGPDADGKPPTPFELAMAVDPVARQAVTKFQVAPLAAEPSLVADLAVTGIRGAGLMQLLPNLQEQIDPSAIRDGQFQAHMEARLRSLRRDDVLPDLSRPFDGEFLLSGVAFRAQPGGPVVLGVNEVRADSVHVDPAARRVVVADLEVTKPIARLRRDKEGVAVADVLVRPRPGSTTPTRGEAVPAAAAIPPENPSRPPPGGPQTNSSEGEIRIDKLTVSGVDVVAEDRTVEPPLVIPIEGLDVEASDISSRALEEDRPIRFNALVNAGKVQFRNPKTGQIESKELFSQAAATGRLSLYPKPVGWARASVTGLELGALAGEAKQHGVTIGGGVFDANVDARFQPAGRVDTRSKFVFNDLKLSEAPDGPITQALKLPAPIDVVIAALEDPGGSITLPISVPVENGNVRGVVPAATGAAAGVIATAVASSPLKAGGAITGTLGLTGKEKEKRAGAKEVSVAFAPGSAGMDPAARRAVTDVARALREDPTAEVTVRHVLGPGDLALLTERLNPPAADAAALAERIRARKMELLRLREQTASQARGQLAAGDQAAVAATVETLRGIDTELAASEDGMDRLYDLVRPGADRQAGRRTRAGAVELGSERLEEVKRLLESQQPVEGEVVRGPKPSERIHIIPARFETPPEGAEGGGRVVLTVVSKGHR